MNLPNSYTAAAAALVGLLVIAAIAAPIKRYGDKRYDAGQAAVQAKWDKSVERGRIRVEELKAAAGRVTVKTELVYVDRIKTIREKGDVIEKRVPFYVPAGTADLPGGWRLLHDDAAAGTVSDAADLAHAAPVGAQAAAGTVVGNYGACLETAQRLTSLQDWIRAQCRLNPPPEGCP